MKIIQETNVKTKEYKYIEVPERGLLFGERIAVDTDKDNWHFKKDSLI